MARHISQPLSRHGALALICMILSAVLTPSASAQTHYSSNITVGAHAGVDFSRVFFNPGVPQKWPVGGVGGLMFRYIEENHFGLLAELNFAQRGWKENFEEHPYSYTRTLNYIELPVMAHIYFGRRGRFFINAGPQVGLFLGESVSADFDPTQISSLPDFPLSNRTNSQLTMDVSQKVDYGICAGLGGEFNLNRRNSLSLEVRFYYGLGNIMKSGRKDVFRSSNQMSIAATVGYWFRIK